MNVRHITWALYSKERCLKLSIKTEYLSGTKRRKISPWKKEDIK